MPTDLKELATAIATYDRLMSEIPGMEQTFSPISDQMLTLGIYYFYLVICYM